MMSSYHKHALVRLMKIPSSPYARIWFFIDASGNSAHSLIRLQPAQRPYNGWVSAPLMVSLSGLDFAKNTRQSAMTCKRMVWYEMTLFTLGGNHIGDASCTYIRLQFFANIRIYLCAAPTTMSARRYTFPFMSFCPEKRLIASLCVCVRAPRWRWCWQLETKSISKYYFSHN